MIVFDLKCGSGHVFECWFRSSSDFAEQKDRGFLSCPHCQDMDITKAVMSPNVTAKSNRSRAPSSNDQQEAPVKLTAPRDMQHSIAAGAEIPAELQRSMDEVLQKIRTHVEANCDDVGKDFADVARKMHYGEAEERGIYGESTAEETRDLLEEGIEIMPLPGPRRTDA